MKIFLSLSIFTTMLLQTSNITNSTISLGKSQIKIFFNTTIASQLIKKVFLQIQILPSKSLAFISHRSHANAVFGVDKYRDLLQCGSFYH